MNDKRRTAREKLNCLTDAIVDDILSATDEEILAEATENHEDIVVTVSQVRGIIDNAIAQSGKEKMQAARMAFDNVAASSSQSNVIKLSLEKKRNLLDQIAANDSSVEQQLTLESFRFKLTHTRNF